MPHRTNYSFSAGDADYIIKDPFTGFFYGLLSSIIDPVLISMMSGMRSYNVVLVEIFITGTIGFPVGVPRPVVNNTMFAPPATSAVVDSTSFPGVHKRFSPCFVYTCG